jgi:hypothetical protein
LEPGLYKVCEIQPVAFYGISSPACKSTGVYAGATSGLFFLALPIARVQWTVVDFIPTVVGGAVFTLADSTTKVIAMFVDNSFTDSDPVPGAFQLQLYIDATFTVCQSSPPPGYYFIAANTVCKTFTTKQGTVTTLANTIAYPIASAVWRVTNGVKDINDQLTLIGPSTFTVSGGPNSVIIPIVDNGPDDFDARVGRLALKLPATGIYSICETVPPVGYKNAAPSCKRIPIATGVPGNGGYFTNQELQVINNP